VSSKASSRGRVAFDLVIPIVIVVTELKRDEDALHQPVALTGDSESRASRAKDCFAPDHLGLASKYCEGHGISTFKALAAWSGQ
jgi:hypothetical protein